MLCLFLLDHKTAILSLASFLPPFFVFLATLNPDFEIYRLIPLKFSVKFPDQPCRAFVALSGYDLAQG